MFFRKLIAFIKKDFLIFRSYRLFLILSCLGAITLVITFYFITKLFGQGINPYLKDYGGEYFPFVLIGLAFYTYFSTALRAFSARVRQEQMMGTLQAIVLTPTKIPTIVFAMPCWDFLFSSLNALICLLLGVCFLGVSFVNVDFLVVLLVLGLIVIITSSIGMISAAFIVIFKKGDPIVWLTTLFFSFFGGVYFPITILPKKLYLISNFLPVTYALRALRHALLGEYSFKMLLPDILILLVFCAVLFPSGILIFKYAIRRAKLTGTLAYY